MDDQIDDAVSAQYEAYPYPPRAPRDEARRLVVGSPSHLREIDHWVFGASRPASHPLRALFAGGGTGDGAIMLAAQLAESRRPGTVVHLDRARAASAVAMARAEARGLRNIVFVHGSLLDAPPPGEAPYDYIDCCGVLHHLPDPAAGLRALRRRLAPDGGLGVMVYAPLGRTGVYELQAAPAALAPAALPPATRLEIARRMMRHVPETAWLRGNRNFADHLAGGDAGLYDLLLSPRDRPFDVAALASLAASGGFVVDTLIEPLRYDPRPLLPDPVLRERASGLDRLGRAALAERLAGDIATHIAYLRPIEAAPPRRADPCDPASVPVGRETTGEALAARIRPDDTYPARFGTLPIPLPLPKRAGAVLRLVDGRRDVAAIAAEAAARGIPPRDVDRIWPALFAALESANRLLLRAPD